MFQLKFVEGAKPGQPIKRKKTEDKKNEENKKRWSKYEEKMNDRPFKESWKEGRSWLNFDESKGAMTCLTCIEFYGTKSIGSGLKGCNTFLTGSTDLKKSAVSDHELSKAHIDATAIMAAKCSDCAAIASSQAGKAMLSLHLSERQRLMHLFRNAHAVGKQGRPITDYTWFCNVTEANGVDLGKTYRNGKAALAFLSYIAGAEKEKTVTMMEAAKGFSLLIDGTTDLSGDEQECVFVRAAINGHVQERFLTIGSPSSTTAGDLKAFVDDLLVENGLEKEKLIGLGSDGTANMVGVRNGLAAKLKQDIGVHFVNIHCFNHRLELAWHDTIKQNKTHDKLITLLTGLYYMYHKQYKNKKGLMNAFTAVQVKPLIPPKATGTRWLPHLGKGVDSLVHNFKAYHAHLSTVSHTNPKAEGLARLLLDRSVVPYVLFLKELLEPLSILSSKLQQRAITLADAQIYVETAAEMVDELRSRPLKKVNEVVENGIYQDIQLRGRKATLTFIPPLIDGVLVAIKSRFCLETTSEMTLVKATKILPTESWPCKNQDKFQEFGNEEVEHAATFYHDVLQKHDVCPEKCVSEWKCFKRVMWKRYTTTLGSMSLADLYTEEFDNLYSLLDLLLSLPPTSVPCESTFSHLKLLKTHRRLRLRQDTLNSLMMIKLSTPDVTDYDPSAAVDKWLGDGLRRLDYQRPAKAMSDGDASDEEDDSEMSAEEDSDIQDKETNDKQILAFLNE